MSHSPTVSTPDLAFSALFDDASDLPLVSGQWFTLRLIPDLVTGELFNVGVAMIDNTGQIHHRLIPDARPFQCLFGYKGLDNFNFLLNTIKKRFYQNDFATPSSPHILFTDTAYASGNSIADIIDSLYNTMVNLQCIDEDNTVLKDKDSLHTSKLRQTIFGRLKKEMPSVYERIYRDTPVYIRDATGSNGIYIDLPIWNSNGNLQDEAPSCFGTIVSAAYKDPTHRGYHIAHGCLNVRNACEMLGKRSKSGIFIYRPSVDAGFSEALNAQIDNEIDSSLYAINQMKKNGYPVNVVVTDDKQKIYEAAAELA